jgi:acetyl esterase/lipase
VVALAVPACRLTDVPLWGPAPPSPADAFPVEQVRDVAYYDGPDADTRYHRLDLFLPKGQRDYPVVLLIHGGGWTRGDNRSFGLYSAVAECLARQGIGVVLPNYRLSPGVKHPEHVRDVARAFAWTHAHIADYGGCPQKLFIAGHSAGGHLAALLATDETYLRAEGLRTADVKGVIGVSGVYRIPTEVPCLTFGGSAPVALRLDEILPLRQGCGLAWSPLAAVPAIPLRRNVFRAAFGNDPDVRDAASPLAHVRPGLPPFLLVCAEKDLPTLPDLAAEFHRALSQAGCQTLLITVKDRNHNSILFRAFLPEDPVAQAMLNFIRGHV